MNWLSYVYVLHFRIQLVLLISNKGPLSVHLTLFYFLKMKSQHMKICKLLCILILSHMFHKGKQDT